MNILSQMIKVQETVGFETIVHSWLKDEWHGKDYDKWRTIIPDTLIGCPDFNNAKENAIRFKLLKAARSSMIDLLLINANWYKVKVCLEDIERIYQCRSSEWDKFSNGTFRVSETVKNVFPDSKIDVPRADKIKEIYKGLDNQPKVNGLILIGTNIDSNLTIIEGCHRFTAVYKKVKDGSNDQLIADYAFVGVNPEMINYPFFYKT